MRNHVIITGTGRTGTTFLVQLLTELGLVTGFQNSNEGLNPICNAGMELDIRDNSSPYIVKNPWMCDFIEDVLQKKEEKIDHAYIPIRDLFSAAESRRFVSAKAGSNFPPDQVPGGLWHTQNPENQESILAIQLYKLLFSLVKYDVPLTYLVFPKLIGNPEYLYIKLWFLLKRIPHNNFIFAFQKVARKVLIHNFSNIGNS